MEPLKPALRKPGSPSRGRIRFAADVTPEPPYRDPFGSPTLPHPPLRGGAVRARRPRSRSASPTRTETVKQLHQQKAEEEPDVLGGWGNWALLPELFDRDRAQGRMRAVGRGRPQSRMTPDHLRTLAKYSVDKLNGSNFFLLWRVMKEELCTVRLGAGNSGSVFRVCKDDGCASCIAVKFGIVLDKDGMVPLEAVGGVQPHGMSDAEWAAGVRDYKLELGPTLSMDGVTWDEVRNTQAITEVVYDTGASPHVMRYLHHLAVRDGVFLFLEYVAPCLTSPARVASLDDLVDTSRGGPILAAMNASEVKALLFQAIYTVGALQAAFPGFRHNDTKPDNWGLTRWDGGDHTYGIRMLQPRLGGGGGGKGKDEGEDKGVLELLLEEERDGLGGGGAKGGKQATAFLAWRLPAQRLLLKLLDFGLAHSSVPAIATADIAHAYKDRDPVYVSFGTVPEPCALYDLHMLLNLLLRGMRRQSPLPAWLPDVEAFVHDCIPAPYFHEPLANQQYRLTVAAQKRLNADVAAGRASGPLAMLQHPYFAEFRMPGASASAAEYKFMAGPTSV